MLCNEYRCSPVQAPVCMVIFDWDFFQQEKAPKVLGAVHCALESWRSCVLQGMDMISFARMLDDE